MFVIFNDITALLLCWKDKFTSRYTKRMSKFCSRRTLQFELQWEELDAGVACRANRPNTAVPTQSARQAGNWLGSWSILLGRSKEGEAGNLQASGDKARTAMAKQMVHKTANKEPAWMGSCSLVTSSMCCHSMAFSEKALVFLLS